jgi:SAM-dependent methyltransferase
MFDGLEFGGDLQKADPILEGLKFYDHLWINHQPDRMGQAEFWDRRAVSFNSHADEDESSQHRRFLVTHLSDRAGLGSDMSVLDIGCGPGKLALLFAERAGQVEACDIAPRMIEVAKSNGVQQKHLKVNFQRMDWNEADLAKLGWEGKFQLVLASKTPAVNDLLGLKKMMAASCGYCCLITHVEIKNSVIEELKPLFNYDESNVRLTRSLYCVFNLLWLLGFYPEIEYFDRAWESDSSLEDAEIMYARHFDRIKPLAESQKKLLAEKLKSLSQGGLVHEQVESRVGVIYWSVLGESGQPIRL